MKKFDLVKKAIEENTKDTNNFVTLTTETDARHSGKYTLKNVVTGNIGAKSFKTLNEVIAEYNLAI